MAKTIKFNLICDGNPVRTLEELRNHFSIEDMSEYYHNQLLHRWLKVRGYEEELTKVEAIQADDDLTLIKNLISVFDVENDEKIVEKDTYILTYRQERFNQLQSFYQQENAADEIIRDYHRKYNELVQNIIQNKDDMSSIKAAVQEIGSHYFSLFELNHRELLYSLIVYAPMAVFAMIMREDMRPFYLPEENDKSLDILDSEEELNDMDVAEEGLTQDKDDMYACICSLVPYAQEMLGDNLIEFSGITDGYWKDLQSNDKNYMILKMEPGNYIRSTGVSGGDLSAEDINNKFVILNGVDYKSNNANHKLLYLEV